MFRPFGYTVSICIALMLAFLASPAVAADKAILVLDASGSMWGQISGKPKIQIAREVIAEILGDWDATTELGLLTYGHRTKGECTDIELLIPTGTVDQAAFSQVVNELNPKGKTPLTEAVRQAAQALKYTEDKATVILVSDGKETCDADPCAVAKELENAGLDFTTHVIGFDIEDATSVAQLQCLAEHTGGEYFAAKNAVGLKDALATAVEQVTAPDPIQVVPEPIKVAPKPVNGASEIAEIDSDAPGNLRTTAIFVTGGAQLTGTNFTVYTETPDEFGEPQRARVNYSGNVSEYIFTLPPGDYVATAVKGNASTETRITIKPGTRTNLVMNLNAANLKTTAIFTTGGSQLSGTNFAVYRESVNDLGETTRNRVNYSGSVNQYVFTLNAGEYIINATKGNASVENRVSIVAGKSVALVLDLNAANVRTTAVFSAGGKTESGVNFTIYRETADDFGERVLNRVNYSGSVGEYVFTLNAGDYIVSAVKGNAQVEQQLSVVAGKSQAVELNMNAAYLKMTAIMKAGGSPVSGTNFAVYRETSDEFGKVQRARVNYSGSVAAYTFSLNAGPYVVTATNGNNTKESRVNLVAGQAFALEMDLSE